MKIKSIEPVGRENVYNMEVESHHNFAVNGGFVVHNCDAARYFVAGRPSPTPIAQPQKIYNFDFERPKPSPSGYGDEVKVI